MVALGMLSRSTQVMLANIYQSYGRKIRNLLPGCDPSTVATVYCLLYYVTCDTVDSDTMDSSQNLQVRSGSIPVFL